METQKDLVNILERIKEDEYNDKVCSDFINKLQLKKQTNGTNGYTKSDLFALIKTVESFKSKPNITNLIHSLKIKEVEKLLQDLQSGIYKAIDSETAKEIEKFLEFLIKKSSRETEIPSREARAELVLDIVFEIGKNSKHFTAEEKKQIAKLMVHSIKPIQAFIKKISCLYRSRLDCSILQKRSALQFLVEDYAQFPVDDNTLLKELFEEVNIQESIAILDQIIEKYQDLSDSSEGESDSESAGASYMPLTHEWWPRRSIIA